MSPKRTRTSTHCRPSQILGSIVILLILAIVLYLNRNNQPASLILTPPPEETSPSAPAELPVTPGEASPPADFPLSPAADFDYYVLSLSWSPQYCAAEGSDDTQQCSLGRKLGFVLHGLWPQFEDGYPEYCTNESFPASLKQDFPALFPSDALYSHEWEKHGTCSGLTPAEYLAASRLLRDSVVIPSAYITPAEPLRVTVEQIRQDFRDANPALAEDGLAVLCSDAGRYLRELRVCFTMDGLPRSCGNDILKDAAKSCGQSSLLVRNVK